MSKSEVKKVSRIKVKKKVWHRIISPKLFGEREMGEMYITSSEEALGRTMKVNLRDLTGNMRDQHAYVNFRIIRGQGTQLYTEAIGYELTAAFVKRMVRKNIDRMDDYFTFKSNEGQVVIVKTLMLTQGKTHRSLQASLRKQLQAALEEEIKKNDFNTFMNNLVSYKVQQTAKRRLHKLFPLKEVAIRVVLLRGQPEHAAPAPEAAQPIEVAE